MKTDAPMVLAIESAVADGSVAVLCGGHAVSVHAGDGASRAERLLSIIESLLAKSGLTSKDLDSIAVSTGPGSYSGIRIGMSTALGLGDALGIPCIGVPLFAAMAYAVTCDKPVTCTVPVGKSDIAWQSFGPREEKRREALSEALVAPIASFVSEIARPDTSVLYSHSGVLERIKSRIPVHLTSLDAGVALAESIGIFAPFSADGDSSMQPIYLRNRDVAARFF